MEGMCAALEHRGPDSRGLHVDGQVGLGIQRLRVIDLETGDQPIYNEDGSVVVVLNGEIYNFRELRRDLLRRGHRFTTEGDTEVIVHLYEEMGVRCVEALHGMFAFALWDQGERRLLLARDRVGQEAAVLRRTGPTRSASPPSLTALLAGPGDPARRRPGRARRLPGLSLRPGAGVGVRRRAQAAARRPTLVLDETAMRTERYWRLDFAAKRQFADAARAQRGDPRARSGAPWAGG